MYHPLLTFDTYLNSYIGLPRLKYFRKSLNGKNIQTMHSLQKMMTDGLRGPHVVSQDKCKWSYPAVAILDIYELGVFSNWSFYKVVFIGMRLVKRRDAPVRV